MLIDSIQKNQVAHTNNRLPQVTTGNLGTREGNLNRGTLRTSSLIECSHGGYGVLLPRGASLLHTHGRNSFHLKLFGALQTSST